MLVGTTLRNHYKIIKQLGSGGFGDAYLAEDRDLPGNPQCVVKHFKPKNPHPAVLPIARRLFDDEVKVLYQLGNHDQIPQLFAHFEENREFYLVQEFVDGHDLTKELTPGKKLSENEVVKLLQGVLEILAFVHQGNIIHRDINPKNLMRRRKDDKIVLIDFGAVKKIRTLVINTQGQVTPTIAIGTPGYMPSEQAKGKPRLCSDVYAVGMIGIQALTGLTPDQLPDDPNGEAIWRNQANVSDKLAKVLEKMVRYNFQQRYQSAGEALEALMPSKSKSILWGVLIGVGGLGIGVVATIALLNRPQSPPQQSPTTSILPPVTSSPVSTPTPSSSQIPSVSPQTINLAIQPRFDVADSFSDGLARVRVDGKWGYIDKSGDIVIQPQFDEAEPFFEGLAVVWISGQNRGYIDKTGRFAIQPQFIKNAAKKFSEGLARVWVVSTFGYIDKTGSFVIERKFAHADNFSEGLARVQIGGKWGYIDKNGNVVIQPQFDFAANFSEGLAVVGTQEKADGYIDKSGNFVIQRQFAGAVNFSEGLALVKVGDKWGYINQSGNIVVQPQFTSAGNFSEGLALVKVGDKWGYINQSGNIVVQPQFAGAGNFSEGLAVVKVGDKWGYINQSGNVVIQSQFTEAYQFSEGLAVVKVGDKYGYIRDTLE
ncbi:MULTISPECIES: WG repeat-containing protein [Cyanophyceae]|uniref:WG repeat-containing protein n=1 Tax=Cyanophyceae TaxID=3028117 RepID=UPI0016823A9B|nr:WG repeat-containing protein [Trichocoleus sp. FACHB-40]MBD2006690.1 WG repeat-containing protein [Trichocoleus sp. FACHB-40]